MIELSSVVIHHIAQAAKKAGVRFDNDCLAELESAFQAAEDRIVELERMVERLTECINEGHTKV